MVKCTSISSLSSLFGLLALATIGLQGAPASAQSRRPDVTGTVQSTGTFVPPREQQMLFRYDHDFDAPLRPVRIDRALTEEEYTFLKSRQGPRPRFKPGLPPGYGSGVSPMTPGYLYETAGLNAYDTGGWTPPDDSFAVGYNSAIQPANSAVGIFARDNTGLTLQSLTDANTFMNFGATPPFDPRAMYDYKTGHFFICFSAFPYLDGSGNPHSNFLLAVSKTNDAFGAWYTYQLDYVALDSRITAGDEPPLFDYPDIGLDGNNVYVTANIFGQQNYYGTTLIAFDKASLEAGKPQAKVPMALFFGLNGTLTPPYVWSQGSSKQSYFLYSQPGSTGPTSNTSYLGLYAVSGKVKDGSIKLSNATNVVVPYYDYPGAAEAPGFVPIDSSDTRFEDKTQQLGEHLYAADCVGLLGFPMIAVYDVNGATAHLMQSVNLIASPTSYDFNASIAVNPYGTAVVNWNSTDISKTVASDNTYESIRTITLPATWPKKPQTGSLVPGGTSTTAYTQDFHNNGYRNGDYSMTVVDPIYNRYFWGIDQTVLDEFDWNTYIFQLGSQ